LEFVLSVLCILAAGVEAVVLKESLRFDTLRDVGLCRRSSLLVLDENETGHSDSF
jgi:hypothetical protein